ncbi:DUF6912 family protein [Paraoerskovia marina]|uniref:DUF6912 family protein n=1 Tax=Paraoerskovia marina TaxID=545619 RepID=UPI000492A803|nr:hypothetical protein [Paraoerskovia marina]
MRLYVPTTLDELLDAASAPLWTIEPRAAHAVTAPLQESEPDEDLEGWEFVAALEAADDSLALIAGLGDVPRQRVVVTVEVPDEAVRVIGVVPTDDTPDDAPAPSAVEIVQTVPEVEIVCAHVDEPGASVDVEAVIAAVDTDDDEALARALDRLGERGLLWYDRSELADIPSE